MAAAITTTATTLEGQLLEIVQTMQIAENNSATNPNGSNFVTGTINTDTENFTGTFNIPVTPAIGAGGVATYAAEAYLV